MRPFQCGAPLQPTPQSPDRVAQDLLASVGLSSTASAAGTGITRPVAPLVARAWEVLGTSLSQWCGPFAYHAVLTRAVSMVRSTVPAMTGLHVQAPPAITLEGLEAIESAYGTGAMLIGVQALMAAMITILGRVIGEDLARSVMSDALEPIRAARAVTFTPSDAGS